MPSQKPKAKQPKPFVATDAASAYNHFLPLAQDIPDEEVVPHRADAALARHNVERGVAAIQPHLDEVKEKLPKLSITSILELPALALALVHADGRVPAAAMGGTIEGVLAEIAPLRDRTLRYLEIAAELGLVPDERVRAIRAGTGKLDKARDCIDIAGLFHELDGALSHKHPFSDEDLSALAQKGTWLVEAIAPKGAVKASAPKVPEAVLRNKFWMLLEQRHDDLRTAGVAVFGMRHVDEHVPPLFSRVVRRKKGAKTEEATKGASAEAKADAPPPEGADAKTADAKTADAKTADAG